MVGPSSKSSRFVSMLFYLSGFENRFTHHVYDKERYIDVHSNLVSSLFYNYPSIKFQYCNERERGGYALVVVLYTKRWKLCERIEEPRPDNKRYKSILLSPRRLL